MPCLPMMRCARPIANRIRSFLTAMGLLKPRTLSRQWRLAIVIIAVIAAAITPTVDPVNMGLVMLPMSLLYFVSIGLSYIANAGRTAPARRKPIQEESA